MLLYLINKKIDKIWKMVTYHKNGRGRVAWQAAKYTEHHFEEEVEKHKTISTKGGDDVQSEGEHKIADFLYDNNIDYFYDKLLKLDEDEPDDKSYWVRPDFIIKGKNVVIEYWGMKYGRADNPKYDDRAERKKALYEQEGYILIEVFAEQLEILEDYLKEKLNDAGITVRY
jgi:hypothetical protein